MKKIGITGGIGSGKTTVCEIFKLLGVSVFHADEEARKLQNTDLHIRAHLAERFGEYIFSSDGLLERKKLAELVFTDKKALSDLNAIIHPAVQQSFLIWTENHHDEPYIIYEAAILFETGYFTGLDRNILVVADEKTRIERVIRRDNTSKDQIMQRIKNQMPDIEKIKLADYIIENNEGILLIPQVLELDKLLRTDN